MQYTKRTCLPPVFESFIYIFLQAKALTGNNVINEPVKCDLQASSTHEEESIEMPKQDGEQQKLGTTVYPFQNLTSIHIHSCET